MYPLKFSEIEELMNTVHLLLDNVTILFSIFNRPCYRSY